MEDRLEEMLLMPKDPLAIQETTLVSNVANKDTLLAIARRGSDAIATTPTLSISMMTIRSIMTTMPRNSKSILSTISKLGLLTSQVTTKPNWQKKWA